MNKSSIVAAAVIAATIATVWTSIARADTLVCEPPHYLLGGTTQVCHVVKGPKVREPKSFAFGR